MTNGLSAATFASVYGDIAKEFDVEVIRAGSALLSALATAGIHTGKLATGEDSTLAAATYAINGAGGGLGTYGYFELEAVADIDLDKTTLTVANFSDYFKAYTYDQTTGLRSEVSITSVNATTGALNFGSGATNGLGITLGPTAKIAEGDKLLISRQGAVAANMTYLQVSDNGQRLSTGNNTGGTQQFSVVQMDEGGNVTVGIGRVTTTAMSVGDPTRTLTVTPKMITTQLIEVDKDKTTADVNYENTKVVGGLYPNGADVTIATAGTSAVSGVTSSIFFQDSNLHATVTQGSTPNDNGSYMITILKSGKLEDLATSGSTSDFLVIFKDAATGLERELVFGTDYTYSSGNTLVIGGSTGILIALNATGTGEATKDDKILVKAYNQPSISAGNARVSVDGLMLTVGDDYIDEFDIYNVELDAAGNFAKSRIHISLDSLKSGTIRFETPDAQVADLSTKLRDIPLFTNADGKNILDNTQELIIYGNNKTATVYVEGSDTVEDFQNKLNAALLELGLGTGDSVVDANLVHYVTEEEATNGGNFALAGTFIIQGAIAGASSKINIIGDQDLINALSLTTLQSGAENELTVEVKDAHNNKIIGKDTIGDGVLRGIIEGIDVKINNPNLVTSYNTATGKITFTAPDEAVKVNLHIADNRTEVQIGANEGQTFDISIAQMNTTSLEIDDAFVITMEESQKAITKFSQALEKVSSARATIGAQINRLDYTVKNLAISRENLISAESRIRDLDVAEESATFARNQILVNSAVAMLAQANTLPQIALQLLQ
jgi:flagellin-like hook-associated protein FlgL